MHGNVPVRLCVQRRLMCSAGVSPAGVRAEAPELGWQAGGEPNVLKPIDAVIFGMAGESPGRNASERSGGPERE